MNPDGTSVIDMWLCITINGNSFCTMAEQFVYRIVIDRIWQQLYHDQYQPYFYSKKELLRLTTNIVSVVNVYLVATYDMR
jgi:hypothetical protein